jgi:hypothetical protein
MPPRYFILSGVKITCIIARRNKKTADAGLADHDWIGARSEDPAQHKMADEERLSQKLDFQWCTASSCRRRSRMCELAVFIIHFISVN